MKFRDILNEDPTSGTAKKVADTILKQMGGGQKLKLMIGARNFAYGTENKMDLVSFHFPASNQINTVKILYNRGRDLYNMEFGYVRGGNYQIKKTFDDIYFDQLISVFEDTTKLYLHL